MAGGDIHDGIHLAGDAGVMNRNDSSCLFGDGVLDFGLVDIHGIRADIHKNGGGTAQNKGVGGGYKSIGRHDHFISRLNICQKRGHLRRMGAGGGQESLRCAGVFLDPSAAEGGISTVSADFVILDCLSHIFRRFRRTRRNIKINHMQSFFSLSDSEAERWCRMTKKNCPRIF